MQRVKNIAVIGASGGSGKNTVEALLERGHKVTALSRSASTVFEGNVNCIDGSAMDREALRKAIQGQDAVIVTLGISENPLRVRLFGPARTPVNVRSAGTQLVIDVMKELGVKRLVVQTTFGTGPSRNNLRFMDRLFFNLLLKPQIHDTELQDTIVRKSGMDWTITQPVHLTDRVDSEDKAYISNTNEVEGWKVSRQLVGKMNAELALDKNSYRKTITVSTKHSVKKNYCNSNAAC